jgi:DNA-binding response OmpR family regulator
VSAGTPATHVLVVDDDQATLGLYRDLLMDVGYAVTLCGRPTDDSAEVARLQPDLILLDLLFNGEERGWTFFLELRQDPATSAIPVLICTAAALVVERTRDELDAWSCGVVLKPFDIDRLLEAVEACLGRPSRDLAAG